MKASFKISQETYTACNQNFKRCTGMDLHDLFNNEWETTTGNKINVTDFVGSWFIQLDTSRTACHDLGNGVGAFLSHIIKNPELITDLKQESIVDVPFYVKNIVWSDDLIIDALGKNPSSFCINETDCDPSGLQFLLESLTIIPTEIVDHRVILGLALHWMGKITPFKFGGKISPVDGVKHQWYQKMSERYELMHEANTGLSPDPETIKYQLHTEIYSGEEKPLAPKMDLPKPLDPVWDSIIEKLPE